MTVKELIKALEKMPQDKTVIMFDDPVPYTPYKVYVADWGGKGIKGNVIIDWIMTLNEKINETLSEADMPEEDKMQEAIMLMRHPEMLEMFD